MNKENIGALSWVIGLPGHGTPPAFDPDQFEKLVTNHRVVGRAIARLTSERPTWSTSDLIDDLKKKQSDYRAFLHEQASTLSELRRRYLKDDRPIMLFKGLSVFQHSGKAESLRRTLDIDLMIPNPEPVVERMRADALEEYRKVSPHELINVRLGGTELDLHGYYPVWSFDRNVGLVALDAKDELTILRHYGKLIVSALELDDLLENAKAASIFDLENVFFPDAAASLLIQCAHCFRDFVSRSSVTARNKPPLKFTDIAEVREYLNLPDFDPARFVELTKKTKALAAIEWMAHIVNEHGADSRLVELVDRCGGDVASVEQAYVGTPQAVWTGFWEVLTRPPSDAIARHMDTFEVVARMGPSIVPMKDGRFSLSIEDDGQVEGIAFPGTVHIRGEGAIPFSVEGAFSRGELALDVVLARPAGKRGMRIHIDVNGQSFEWHCYGDNTSWKKSEAFPVKSVDSVIDNEIARVEIALFTDLRRLRSAANAIPLVLAAGTFGDDFDIQQGTFLPLLLTQPSN